MKSKIWRVLLSLLLLSLIASEFDSRAPSRAINDHYSGKKIALVIGNWAYRFKPLNSPQNDARDMAQLLSQLGFEVIHKENLGFEEMEDEVIQFKIRLMDRGEVGLFYFAGHGLEVQKVNYLLPTDLRVPERQLVKRKAIEAQWVVDVMDDAGSEVNIVILDACRTFPRPDNLSEEYGLAAMNAPKGTLIGFASALGQSTPDGKKGTNGLYTGYLLKFMRQAGLSLDEVFKMTRQQVARVTGNSQVPLVYNSLFGDFCLVSCPKAEMRHLEALKSQPVLSQSDDALFAPGKVFRDRLADGSFGPEMVWIPAGSFRMGNLNVTSFQGGSDDDELPVHEVSVGRFAMGKYQVTVGEYLRFVRATGSHAPEWMEAGNQYNIKTGSSDYYKRFGSALTEESRPIVGVSWNDAVAYANWLSLQTGKTYRLPTEAEWEYAARGGTETNYWWGDEVGSNNANCLNSDCNDRFKYTAPVGSFAPNPFKLYDMLGNVWEWSCSEYESKYGGQELRCAKNVNENSRLSLRGGSWVNDAMWMRSANRGRGWPSNRDGSLGLRVARQKLFFIRPR